MLVYQRVTIIVAVPLPAQAAPPALARDIYLNDQKVYVDLSLRLDFSQSVIAAAISWKGATDLASLPAATRDLIVLDGNDARDRAIAESTAAGQTAAAETRANVSMLRSNRALVAARFNKTELFALILNEVAPAVCTRLMCFSPQLCVGFLFLILYPGLLLLPPPPSHIQQQQFHTHKLNIQ